MGSPQAQQGNVENLYARVLRTDCGPVRATTLLLLSMNNMGVLRTQFEISALELHVAPHSSVKLADL